MTAKPITGAPSWQSRMRPAARGPSLARTAARILAGAVVEADTAAPVRLLADLRGLFATTTADRLATAAIIRHLTALEDRPWADDAQGHPLTPRHLATLLDGFRIKAKQIRQGAATRKGYLRSDFTDAFHRYLPADPKHPKHPKHRHGAAELAIQKRAAASWGCPGSHTPQVPRTPAMFRMFRVRTTRIAGRIRCSRAAPGLSP